MEANAVLRVRLFELRDRLKADSKTNTGRYQRICSDEAIAEMALLIPRKVSDFGLIQGLGKMFMRNYAEEFLSVLNGYAADSGQETESIRMRGEVECALQELEREGLVYSQRTAGRFVTEDIRVIEENKRILARDQLDSFLKAMKELGYDREEIIALLKEEK